MKIFCPAFGGIKITGYYKLANYLLPGESPSRN